MSQSGRVFPKPLLNPQVRCHRVGVRGCRSPLGCRYLPCLGSISVQCLSQDWATYFMIQGPSETGKQVLDDSNQVPALILSHSQATSSPPRQQLSHQTLECETPPSSGSHLRTQVAESQVFLLGSGHPLLLRLKLISSALTRAELLSVSPLMAPFHCQMPAAFHFELIFGLWHLQKPFTAARFP